VPPDLRILPVGGTGFEPVTSSVSDCGRTVTRVAHAGGGLSRGSTGRPCTRSLLYFVAVLHVGMVNVLRTPVAVDSRRSVGCRAAAACSSAEPMCRVPRLGLVGAVLVSWTAMRRCARSRQQR
jgi:hypothetical protein